MRRFCQDDAHIFCREDQIKGEVLGALDFMKYVYGIFGMSYKVCPSCGSEPASASGAASASVSWSGSLQCGRDDCRPTVNAGPVAKRFRSFTRAILLWPAVFAEKLRLHG